MANPFYNQGVLNYPLIGGLGTALTRGMQYQNQLTPYPRDAKSDWARALDEGINQFFSSYPGYLQQQRANQLQAEELAYQKKIRPYEVDRLEHLKKTRPLDLKKMEIENQMLQRQQQMIKDLPEQIGKLNLTDDQRAMLGTMTPTEQVKTLQAILKHDLTKKKPVLSMMADDPRNPFNKFVQFDETGRAFFPEGTKPQTNIQRVIDPEILKNYPDSLHPFLLQDLTAGKGGQILLDPSIKNSRAFQQQLLTEGRDTPSARFKKKFPNPDQVQSFADLALYAGKTQGLQELFALSHLSKTKPGTPGHDVYQLARKGWNENKVLASPKGYIKLEGYISDPQNKSIRPLDSHEVQKGDSISKIQGKFASQGMIEPSQLMSLNPDYFPVRKDGNRYVEDMLTTAQVEKLTKTYRPMSIPFGGRKLSNEEINKGQSSFLDTRGKSVKVEGLGEFFPMHTATTGEVLTLTGDMDDMKDMIANIDTLLSLYEKPGAVGFLNIGEYKGAINAMGWRIVNNIQVLRQYGVITPGEMVTIRESVPDPSAFFALMKKDYGGKQYIRGMFNALKQEAERKRGRLQGYLDKLGAPNLSTDKYNLQGYRDIDASAEPTGAEAELRGL